MNILAVLLCLLVSIVAVRTSSVGGGCPTWGAMSNSYSGDYAIQMEYAEVFSLAAIGTLYSTSFQEFYRVSTGVAGAYYLKVVSQPYLCLEAIGYGTGNTIQFTECNGAHQHWNITAKANSGFIIGSNAGYGNICLYQNNDIYIPYLGDGTGSKCTWFDTCCNESGC